MESNYCLICQLAVSSNNKIDMQLTTTSLGQVNVMEFLKDSILEVDAATSLRSNFLCKQCFAAVNTLEDHFIMYKSIQQSLLIKYCQEKSLVNIKHELIDETAKPKEEIKSNVNILEVTVNETTSEAPSERIAQAENIGETGKVKSKTFSQERKSPRKRKEIPNYIEQDETITPKKTKKIGSAAKASQQETKHNSSNKNKDDDLILPAKPAYCCEICGKQYVNYNGFNIHRRKHKNENLIRCEYCDKTFAQKGGLRRHLHQHTGTFPYQCDICDKKFTHQSSLKIHKDIHEGRRDYICDTCGMAFYSRAHLRSHINRHTKERLHGCDECGATFTEKYNMRVHRLKVHGIKD